jgi:hypothetical protein
MLGPFVKSWPLRQFLDVFAFRVWPLRTKPEDFQRNLVRKHYFDVSRPRPEAVWSRFRQPLKNLRQQMFVTSEAALGRGFDSCNKLVVVSLLE